MVPERDRFQVGHVSVSPATNSGERNRRGLRPDVFEEEWDPIGPNYEHLKLPPRKGDGERNRRGLRPDVFEEEWDPIGPNYEHLRMPPRRTSQAHSTLTSRTREARWDPIVPPVPDAVHLNGASVAPLGIPTQIAPRIDSQGPLQPRRP